MAYDVTASFQDEARKIEGIQPIDMYVVNASYSGWDPTYYASYNQNIYGYALNSSGDVTATEQIYTGFPIARNNITNNTQGEIGGVSISIPNTDRAIESVLQNHDYLRGCDVHIVSFFAKHLPSGSAAGYIGTSPDHNAGMKEKFYVDGASSNQESVTLSCKSKFNIRGIVIPGRKFSRECAWEYGSTECNASATVVASWATCDKSLLACRVRSNEEHFGGFPSIPTGFSVIP